jgi:hypothetical protein
LELCTQIQLHEVQFTLAQMWKNFKKSEVRGLPHM